MTSSANTEEMDMRKCNSCLNYAEDPVLGHFLCSGHRDCAGETQWNPNHCDVCLQLKEDYSSMNKEERDAFLGKLRTMLKRMERNLSTKERPWEFRNILSAFLGDDIPPASTRSSESGEISPNSPFPQKNTPQRESSIIYQNADLPLPAHPELTQDLLTQLLEQIGNLSQAVGQLQIQSQNNNMNQESSHVSRKEAFYGDSSPLQQNRPGSSLSQVSYNSELSLIGSKAEFPTDPRQMEISQRSVSPNVPEASQKQYFIEDEEMYIYTNKDHKFVGNKVMIDSQLKYYKWHASGKAFSILKSSNKEESPFMLPSQAHETLVSYFKATQEVHDKSGSTRRCYRTHFDGGSELADAMNIISAKTSTALHNLYAMKEDGCGNVFPNTAFRPCSLVNFSSGWTLTGSDYMKWARFEPLCMKEVSRQLRVNYNPCVPKAYLEKEKITRSKIVDCLSGLNMLESASKSIKDNITLSSTLDAISRHWLPFLKEAVSNWISAKFDVRKIVLQGSTTAAAIDLLLSDIWDASLFPTAIVEEVKKKDSTLDLKSLLGLSRTLNITYEKQPSRINPSEMMLQSHSPNRSNIPLSQGSQRQPQNSSLPRTFLAPPKRNFQAQRNHSSRPGHNPSGQRQSNLAGQSNFAGQSNQAPTNQHYQQKGKGNPKGYQKGQPSKRFVNYDLPGPSKGHKRPRQ